MLQVVQDLCGVADDVVLVGQDRNLSGRIQTHEPRLVVFAQRQAHIILLAAQAFLRYGQTNLRHSCTVKSSVVPIKAGRYIENVSISCKVYISREVEYIEVN